MAKKIFSKKLCTAALLLTIGVFGMITQANGVCNKQDMAKFTF